MSQLSVLLVATAQDQSLLTDFLMRRQCQVHAVGDPDNALQVIHQQHQARTKIDIVLADIVPPCNGQELAEQLRRQYSYHGCICWLSDYQYIDDDLQRARNGLTVEQIFSKPVDLAQLARFIEQKNQLNQSGAQRLSSSHYHNNDKEDVDAQPFFGNSSSGVFHSNSGSYQRSNSGSYQRSNSGSYQRSNSGTYKRINSDPFGDLPESGAISRRSRSGSGSGVYEPNPRDELKAKTTERLRRSVTGTFRGEGSGSYTRRTEMVQTNPQQQKQVRCAHCQQIFTVVRREESYIMPCIHCGGLNRIMP